MVALKNFYSYLGTTHWLRVGAILFVVLLAVGYAVGFATAAQNAQAAADDDQARRLNVYNAWQMDLVAHFTRAKALAATMAAYGTANAVEPLNWSSSLASRIHLDNSDAFYSMCNSHIADLPGIYAAVFLPGGVTSGVCPRGAIPIGFAAIANPAYLSTFDAMYATGGPVVTGPTWMVTQPGSIAINAWYPIFLNASTENRTRATFWGTGAVIVELTRFARATNMSNLVYDHGLDYALWFTEDLAVTEASSGAPASTNLTSATTQRPSYSQYEVMAGTVRTTVISTSSRSREETRAMLAEGMHVTLPVSQAGKVAYFSIYPRGGPVSSSIPTGSMLAILLAVLVGSALVVSLLFAALLLNFLHRHRHAPRAGTEAFFAALTLRGAQPIAEHSPLEAVRMFGEFGSLVRREAAARRCYVICDVGDRTVYVAARDADAIADVCKAVVFDVCIQGTTSAAALQRSVHEATAAAAVGQDSETNVSNSVRGLSMSMSYSRARTRDRETATNQSASSLVGTALCRPSAALHTATAQCVYDAAKDAYFFGNAAHVGKLCGALDGTKSGEVGWTAAVEETCGAQCRALESSAVSCHTVSEDAEVVLHVASLWKETGDERDNEDPSVAMAALSDVYVRRMTVIVSEGRQDAKDKRRKKKAGVKDIGGSNNDEDSSHKSADAAAVTRSATLLHIAVLGVEAAARGGGGGRMPLDVVRRVVAEERGAVVSAHENVMVAAFNLLSPGGHHQVRAASVVSRLRAALPSTAFVCSIHHGAVTALIADGLMMCSGDAVSAGRALLDRAVALRSAGLAFVASRQRQGEACVSKADDGRDLSVVRSFEAILRNNSVSLVSRTRASVAGQHQDEIRPVEPKLIPDADGDLHGLCLLYCHSELSSTYECEAVDVLPTRASAANTSGVASAVEDCGVGKLRVAYRLAHPKSNKATDDEWMYRLRDEEDQSPFAVVNAVFERLSAGDKADAARIWSKLESTEGVSAVALASVERHLDITDARATMLQKPSEV